MIIIPRPGPAVHPCKKTVRAQRSGQGGDRRPDEGSGLLPAPSGPAGCVHRFGLGCRAGLPLAEIAQEKLHDGAAKLQYGGAAGRKPSGGVSHSKTPPEGLF